MKKKQGILVLILTVIVVGFLAFTTSGRIWSRRYRRCQKY